MDCISEKKNFLLWKKVIVLLQTASGILLLRRQHISLVLESWHAPALPLKNTGAMLPKAPAWSYADATAAPTAAAALPCHCLPFSTSLATWLLLREGYSFTACVIASLTAVQLSKPTPMTSPPYTPTPPQYFCTSSFTLHGNFFPLMPTGGVRELPDSVST